MNNNYAVYLNGFRVAKLDNTNDQNAIAYAENYAQQHQNDWVSVIRLSPREEIYNRCLSFGEEY